MDQAVPESSSTVSSKQDQTGLTYKFQRLREKLRDSIASGELSGKLPGERALAEKFHVNAKTLSKALTDLAAEGLLDRSIGRGTYVKGTAPAVGAGRRWLAICDPEQVDWEIIQLIRTTHPELETVTDVSSLRPSFLNQFGAVIDFAGNTPDLFIRDRVVRGVNVVLVGKEPRIYSTHAVVFDCPLASSQATRKLILSGHRSLAAVERPGCSVVADNLRLASERFGLGVVTHSCSLAEVTAMVDNGVTGFICESIGLAEAVKSQLNEAGIPVPERASLVAMGSASDQCRISGYFVQRQDKAGAVVQLMKDLQSSRPTTIWLAGQFVDCGTIAPVEGAGMLQTDEGLEGSLEHVAI